MFSISGISQTAFDWYPNDTIQTTVPSTTSSLLKIEQINLTGDTLDLGIEVIYKDVPASWDGMVCVEGACLGIVPEVGFTAPMLPISGSTNGYVRWTVNPMGGTQSAELKIRVYDLDNPTDGDTAVWIIESVLGVDDLNTQGSFDLFPNPALETINISNSDKLSSLEFYAVDGKLTETFELNGNLNESINISQLPSGMYVVKALSQGEVIGTRKVSVR